MIAQVQGLATAAGCQLVATCDLAVASEEAAVRHAGREESACSAPRRWWRLTRAMGRKRAMEMLLTGKPSMRGARLTWGLVNRLCAGRGSGSGNAHARLPDRRGQPVHHCHRQAGLSTRRSISISRKAYAYAKEVMSMNAPAYDAQEGITAFLDKRAACWHGPVVARTYVAHASACRCGLQSTLGMVRNSLQQNGGSDELTVCVRRSRAKAHDSTLKRAPLFMTRRRERVPASVSAPRTRCSTPISALPRSRTPE